MLNMIIAVASTLLGTIAGIVAANRYNAKAIEKMYKSK